MASRSSAGPRALWKWVTFLRLAIAMTAALGKVHQRGLVHKDLKPPNVFVNSVWRSRLTGFGIASRLPRERQAPNRPKSSPAHSPTWHPNRPDG